MGVAKIRSNYHSGQYASGVPSDHGQIQALVEPLSLPGSPEMSTSFFARQLKKGALGSEILFSRTNNCPTDLISFAYRIASVTFEALYCLCVYMVVQLHAHKNKHLQSVLYIFLREHCPDGL